MRSDLKNDILVAHTLRPESRTGTVNGASVDLANFDAATVALINGVIGGTTPSFTFQIQDSDDDSAWAAVADEFLDPGQPAAFTTGDTIVRVGYHGIKRYLRVAITAVTGTSPTLLNAATVICGKPRRHPV
jgi:hypothetical protein